MNLKQETLKQRIPRHEYGAKAGEPINLRLRQLDRMLKSDIISDADLLFIEKEITLARKTWDKNQAHRSFYAGGH